MSKTFKKRLLIVLASFLALIFLVLGAVTIAISSGFVKGRLLNAVNNALLLHEIEMDWASMRISRDSSISVSGLLIKHKGQYLFSAEKIEAGPLFPGIFFRPIHIGKLSVIGPEIFLLRDEDGVWSLPAGPEGKDEAVDDKPPTDGLSLPIIVDSIEVEGGKLAVIALNRDFDDFEERFVFGLRGALEDRLVRLENLFMRSSQDDFSLAATGALAFEESFPLSLTLEAEAASLEKLKLLIDKIPGLKDVAVKVSVKGNAKSLTTKLVAGFAPDRQVEAEINANIAAQVFDAEIGFKNLDAQDFDLGFAAHASGELSAWLEGFDLLTARAGLELALADSEVAGYTISQGRIMADLDAGRIPNLEAGFTSPGGQVELKGQGFVTGLFDQAEAIDFTAELAATKLDPAFWSFASSPAGSLGADVKLAFAKEPGAELKDFTASAALEAGPGFVERMAFEGLSAAGTADVKGFEISKFDLAFEGGALSLGGAADYSLAGRAFVQVKIEDLSFLSSLFMEEPLFGSFNMALQAEGDFARPGLNLKADAANIRTGDIFLDAGKLEYEGNPVSRSGKLLLLLDNAGAFGRQMEALAVKAEADAKTAGFSLEAKNLQGVDIDLAGTASGFWERQGSLLLKRLSVKTGEHLWKNAAPLVFDFTPDSVKAKDLAINGPGHSIVLGGELYRSRPSSLALAVKNLDIELVTSLAGADIPLAGSLNLDLAFSGLPEKPKGRLDAAIEGFSFEKNLPPAQVAASASYENDLAKANVSFFTKDSGSLEAGGVFGLNLSWPLPKNLLAELGSVTGPDGSLRPFFFASAQNLDLALIAPVSGQNLPITGRADLELALSGSLKNPLASLSFSLLDVAPGTDLPLVQGAADASYENGLAKANISFFTENSGNIEAGGLFGINLSWPLPENLLAELSSVTGPDGSLRPFFFASAQNLDLALIAPVSGQNLPITGRADLELALSGSLKNPLASLSLSLLDVAPGQGLPKVQAEANASYEKGTAKLNASLTPESGGQLDLVASLPLTLSWPLPENLIPENGLSASLHGEALNLDFLAGWTDSVEKLDLTASISALAEGNPLAPKSSGSIRVEGQAVVAGWNKPIEDIIGRISWDESEFVLDTLSAKTGPNGRLEASAKLGHENFKPGQMEARLRVQDLDIAHQRWLAVQIPQIAVDARGLWPEINIDGSLTVGEGTLFLDRYLAVHRPSVATDRDIVVVGRQEEQQVEPLPILQDMEANARIRVSGPFWIRGAGAQILLAGDVTARKRPQSQDFTLLGHLETVRGFYEFKGRTFAVERGRVNFVGQTPPNPILDIVAAHRIGDVTIYLNIGGTIEQTSLTLSSNPPMSETDIASYLLFGKRSDQLTQGESGSLAEQGAAFLGSQAIAELKAQFGESVPVDILTIEAGGGMEADSLVMGKQVTPELFVIYKRGMGPGGKNELELEYQLWRSFTLESRIAEENTGVDIFWRYDY
jgi:autotransporter translocation and assembly factor TamB